MSSPSPDRNKPRKPRQGPVYEKYAKARALGPISPVKPLAYREDGSPLLAAGQVYVTRAGQKYHPAWCTVMAETFAEHPKTILVTAQADVGERPMCGACANPVQASDAPPLRDFRFENAQWQDLTGQVNRQARAIADRLLAQGPAAVQWLGPQMDRYAEAKSELEKLSLRLAGTRDWTSPAAPNWDSERRSGPGSR